ncbi:transmembrane protein 269 isoform X1 [Neofelis nebulosa]|uniref:transmembrane protein 269 isoform X1 n=2 Tax=Neofelis nebulosa TaxID=61452 RepID=UPI00272D6118|nr:transmembrane protein 269 isoform X1 [Neofelis nebulosa]
MSGPQVSILTKRVTLPRLLSATRTLWASCWAQGTSVSTQVACPAVDKEDKRGGASVECRVSHAPDPCTRFFLTNDQIHLYLNEFSWKDVTSALSLANMILGLFSIFCSFCKKCYSASWMLLISFLLDMAVGTITRHLSLCSRSGVELNDFAVFTTFGLASALLLGVDGPLNAFLAVIYVLAATFRLCFYSTGVPFTYKGLPCRYASCVLASTCLLTKGNTFILSCMASLMILFMMDQSYYPCDEILGSENWKKLIYLGGVIMLLVSPFSLTAFYCLMWSLSYIFFPDALWGKAACFRL